MTKVPSENGKARPNERRLLDNSLAPQLVYLRLKCFRRYRIRGSRLRASQLRCRPKASQRKVASRRNVQGHLMGGEWQ